MSLDIAVAGKSQHYSKEREVKSLSVIRGPFKIVERRRFKIPRPRPAAFLQAWVKAGLPKLNYKGAMLSPKIRISNSISGSTTSASNSTTMMEKTKNYTHSSDL